MNRSTPTPPTGTDAGLAAALRMAVGRLARRLRAQRPDSSLSLGQGSVLFALARHGKMTPGALADHEKVQPPSMTRIIAALEARGLVRRMRHPDDGRQQLVEITEEGSRLVAADQQRREAWLTRRLAELSQEDKEVLRRATEILDRLSQS
ncbi:MarR family winged helix-turn-helix transcriptional regulator [Thermobifida cellulosilytica]|uniref:MarR family transcriptional regulator n=1 Tax=Thermobifida cellulosilytica TB100 TaxID=665004 RepID=A0A147KLZ8_THECS|nr:MarR family transcriptional regulator [Thermobifida cellulosilytica TB100]